MKIQESYIENFGKLHHFKYSFEDGLNTINELNGWGKSTFAAFIKAMFYGMDASRVRKNIDEDERKKYMPWQGGAMCGYIIFELNDKQYKIERSFGDKNKDDKFTLYDLKTGLVSKDFTENIGEEIFKIDKAAYSKSTYIPQNSISVELNDSLNAKLSSLIENNNANDINNYDVAMKLLESSKKEYVKTGGRGKIDLIKNKREIDNQELIRCQASLEAVENWNEKLGEIIKSKKEIKDKLQKIKNQVDAASKYETQITKLNQYNEMLRTYHNIKLEIDPLQVFFKEQMPSDEDIKDCDERSSNLLQKMGELKSFVLSKEEELVKETLKEYFVKGLPEEKEIADCEVLIAKYRENSIKINANEPTDAEKLKKIELDAFFENGVPNESEIDAFVGKISILNGINSNITTEKSKLDLLKNFNQNNQLIIKEEKSKNILLPIGIIIALLGIGLLMVSTLVGIAGITVGLALSIISIAVKQNSKPPGNINSVNKQTIPQDSSFEIKKLIDNLTTQRTMIEVEFNDFISQFPLEVNMDNYYLALSIIKTKLGEFKNIYLKFDNKASTVMKNNQTEIIHKINSYLGLYCDDLSISMDQKERVLKKVISNMAEYIRILEKSSKYESIKNSLGIKQEKLIELLNPYFSGNNQSLSENVSVLKENRKEYIRLSSELDAWGKKKSTFESENNIKLLNNIEVPEYKLHELQEKEKELEENLDLISTEENNAREQIRILSEDSDQCLELQNSIDQLGENIEVSQGRLNIIDKTITCLKDAKDSFAIRYMDGMNQGFERYINILDHGSPLEAHIDVAFHVNILQHGAQRTLDYFSTGYKDLVGLATRFALVDALFEHEKPFIILDDPFTNLDDEKLNNALDMIQEISKKYQIIYFICHESRAVNN